LRILATGEDAVRNVLTVQSIFGTDLPADTAFTTPVTEAYRRLRHHGVQMAAQ
jgi:mannitol-1-phosphate/altronate dehydrogenase